MRIACLTSHLHRPSYRFRIEQMRPYFADRGHTITPLVLPRRGWQRLKTFSQTAGFDAVIVQQHTFGPINQSALQWSARKIVYDVDDAVFLRRTGRSSQRREARFRRMLRGADLVTCGNAFLADIARKTTDRVIEIPTAIDTARFARKRQRPEADRVVIVWTGSRSTSGYLRELMPVFELLPDYTELKIISDFVDESVSRYPLRITREIVRWSPETEVTELATGDIGIMPLPYNEWTRGKCGCKALQYMAIEMPAVCSPVGVNSAIIDNGVSGFLPATTSEWLAILTKLVEDESLRRRIGTAGRQRVEETYALNVVGPKFVEAVESVVASQRRRAA